MYLFLLNTFAVNNNYFLSICQGERGELGEPGPPGYPGPKV